MNSGNDAKILLISFKCGRKTCTRISATAADTIVPHRQVPLGTVRKKLKRSELGKVSESR